MPCLICKRENSSFYFDKDKKFTKKSFCLSLLNVGPNAKHCTMLIFFFSSDVCAACYMG